MPLSHKMREMYTKNKCHLAPRLNKWLFGVGLSNLGHAAV